jgi:hypothetical protein
MKNKGYLLAKYRVYLLKITSWVQKKDKVVKIQVKQKGVLDLGQGKIQYSPKDL